MRKINLIVCSFLLSLTSCKNKHSLLDVIMPHTVINVTVIGAGQSNMEYMDLTVFQKYANNVSLVINEGVGGSFLTEWAKGTSYYTRLINSAKGQSLGAILWWQGESEALSGTDYQTWGERFTKFVCQVRSDLGNPHLRFIIVELGPSLPGYEKTWDSIRRQQEHLNIPYLQVINIDDIPRTNGVHYDTQAYAQIAQRLANAYNCNEED